MDFQKTMFIPHKTIQEEILDRLSATLPEDGPYMVLVDQRGNAISGHSPSFNRTLENCKIVVQACIRLADGCDPSCFEIDGI